jgi:hypothetical protein
MPGTSLRNVFNTPENTYIDRVALGQISGVEFRTFFGGTIVGEGVGSEQVLGDGMTTRYPFPSTAAQMTIVSTDSQDTFTGSGARVLLVRGNITNNVELFEAVSLSGTTPVTTSNNYLRVNSIIIANTGVNKVNIGDITLKNGTDLLAQANAGNNLSRTAVYSIPSGVTGILKEAIFTTAKDDSAIIKAHFFLSTLSNLDLTSIFTPSYQNQIVFPSESPLALTEGSDLEFTGFSTSGAGASDVSSTVSLTLTDNQ